MSISRSSVNVLLVEDHSDWHKIFKDIIEEQEFRCLSAFTRLEAMGKLQNSVIHIAVIDLFLSQQDGGPADGLMLINDLHNHGDSSRRPKSIIAVSGNRNVDWQLTDIITTYQEKGLITHFIGKDMDFDTMRLQQYLNEALTQLSPNSSETDNIPKIKDVYR